MINQSIMPDVVAVERPVNLRVSDALKTASSRAAPAMIARAEQYAPKVNGLAVRPVAAEDIGSFVVTVPKSNTRQRRALITFAVEDHIAVPIDTVQVVQGPLETTTPGTFLAFVIANDLMASIVASDAAHIPEYLLISRPTGETTPAWSVWKDGSKAIVRCSDGTGFSASATMLPLLWQRAGKPALVSLGDPLPDGLPAQDLSNAPPPPDPVDLTFSFPQTHQQGAAVMAGWRWAAIAVAAALVAQLGFAAYNTTALHQIARSERNAAEQAVAAVLPGVALTRDVDPILARLTPAQTALPEGTFLPLLSEVMATLAASDTPIGFRRMSWGSTENNLIVLMQSPSLDDLQNVQQDLEVAGFTVRSGAATAGNGGAEVEMRIGRGNGG